MKISVISFTRSGRELAERIAQEFSGSDEIAMQRYTKYRGYYGEKTGAASQAEAVACKDAGEEKIQYVESSVGEWAKTQLQGKNTMLFIGACGIAVRAVAPYLTDKLHDPAVLVMDEKGRYVIPILSGHVGGANALAQLLAEKTGAEPVITTATDLEGRFAVDLFAQRNRLTILNKEGIAAVSAKVLAGEKIMLSIERGHMKEDAFIPEDVRVVEDMQLDRAADFRKGEASYSTDTPRKEEALYSADTSRKGEVSYSTDTPRKEEALYSADTSRKEEVSYSADTLRKEEASYSADTLRKEEPVDVAVTSRKEGVRAQLILRPKEYVIGLGCKKGKSDQEIANFIDRKLKELGILPEDIWALASVSLKREEPGILAWCRKERIPFLTYTPQELKETEGKFSGSVFVQEQVGVDNVCERAAVKACGRGGRLIAGKYAENGMTIAVAKREWSVRFEES